MRELPYNSDYISIISLSSSLEHAHFAKMIAELTINWGRLEYNLYCILLFIDERRADTWTKIYFKKRNIEPREKAVKGEVLSQMNQDHPEYTEQLEAALAAFKDVRERRNLLAHGLWQQAGPREFRIIPMRLDHNGNFADAEVVGLRHLAVLLNDMEKVAQQLNLLATEMMVHHWLLTREARRSQGGTT